MCAFYFFILMLFVTATYNLKLLFSESNYQKSTGSNNPRIFGQLLNQIRTNALKGSPKLKVQD